MRAKLLTLIFGIAASFPIFSQTSSKNAYILHKNYFHSRDIKYIPTGTYSDSTGKKISVQAFFMTNEITNKQYREFVNYVISHPDSSIYFFEPNKEGNFVKVLIPFSQFRQNLIDSSALASKYQPGSDLNKKYKNYFLDEKFNEFPVVGVSFEAAKYYCIWKTRQENEKLQEQKQVLINDFRIPEKEEMEYAQSFSQIFRKKPATEINKSISGKPDKLGLYNLFGNVEELNTSMAKQKINEPIGFRMVSTFLGK